MTKARQATLAVLKEAEVPLTAAEIHNRVSCQCDPVTVYRTLHYLEQHAQADSFILHCSAHGTERYYTYRDACGQSVDNHRHWFHCEQCHRFIDLGNCTIDALVETYSQVHGFEVHSHTLSLTGTCAACRSSQQAFGQCLPGQIQSIGNQLE
jgi:Fur family ferric uptake transcriptional regulator